MVKERERFTSKQVLRTGILSSLTFFYTLWAIAGSGQEAVYWGFLALLCGIPVFVWFKWTHAKSQEDEPVES
jgi:APA family basic amino acid/polyamine antiporter